MWRTDTYWFDVALVSILLAFGNMAFGRFEEHRPRWVRALKIVIGLALFVGVSALAGRPWMYALMGLTLVLLVVVHGVLLPRRGVNGWTMEPRERYYALRGLGPDGRPHR